MNKQKQKPGISDLIAVVLSFGAVFLLVLPDWITYGGEGYAVIDLIRYFRDPSAIFAPRFVSFISIFAWITLIVAIITCVLLLIYGFTATYRKRGTRIVGRIAFIAAFSSAFMAFLSCVAVNYYFNRAGIPEGGGLYLTVWPYILFVLGLFMAFYYVPHMKVVLPEGAPAPSVLIKNEFEAVKEEPVKAPKKHSRGVFKRLFGYLKPYRFRLIIAVVCIMLASVAFAISPFVLGKATDQIIHIFVDGQRDVAAYSVFVEIIVWLGISYIMYSIFNYLGQFTLAGATERTLYDLRAAVDAKIKRLPLNYFDTNSFGDVLSRVTNDVDTIAAALQTSIYSLINAVTLVIVMLIMMLMISPLLTLAAILIVPIALAVTMLIVKKGKKFFKAQQDAIGELNGYVEEMYEGHNVIAAFGREGDVTADFNKTNDKLYQNGWKAQFVSSILMPVTMALTNIGYAVVAVAGALMVVSGQLSIGMIQSFVQYLREFSQPITETAQISNVMQSTAAAAERIFEFLDETEETPDRDDCVKPEGLTGNVEFEHVRFGYVPEKVLIHDLSAVISPGNKIAIVGPTGAGKTTLVNLLLRFYEINSGKIAIDGVSINDMTREDLRSNFGMVLQDTWLFSGTIRDNIRYGRLSATDEEVEAAARAAHCEEFIELLPGGYDFVLHEGAANLAQGQRQLLTIARAILSDPVILILDEATSSVDTRTEKTIQHAMQNLMHGRTSFVIAHRLSTIKDSEMILYMQDGDILEKGTHDELIAKNGLYAALYNSQFQGAES